MESLTADFPGIGLEIHRFLLLEQDGPEPCVQGVQALQQFLLARLLQGLPVQDVDELFSALHRKGGDAAVLWEGRQGGEKFLDQVGALDCAVVLPKKPLGVVAVDQRHVPQQPDGLGMKAKGVCGHLAAGAGVLYVQHLIYINQKVPNIPPGDRAAELKVNLAGGCYPVLAVGEGEKAVNGLNMLAVAVGQSVLK